MPKFYVKPEDIGKTHLAITGEDVKHVSRVLRYDVGDYLTVFDGKGNDYIVSITKIENDCIEADINSMSYSEAEPDIEVSLYQAIPKSEKMEWIIQKSVELGIKRIVPVVTERTIIDINRSNMGKKLERWNRIALEATKQCGRAAVPVVENAVSIKEIAGDIKDMDMAVLPYENEEKKCLKDFLKCYNIKSAKKIALLIGPEGGFSSEEVGQLRRCGFSTVSLGKRILRTETAAVAVLAIIMNEMGEML